MLLSLPQRLPAATYRWVDANGVVHYSDRPQPGAEKVQLPPAQTYNGPAPGSSAADANNAPTATPSAAAAQDNLGTSDCAIVAPEEEQTYNNISSMTVRAKGPLGGEVRLMLDGGVVQKGPVPEFLVSPIDRGMHRAVVVFVSPGGGELCRTKPVVFYVRKTSVLLRKRR